MSRPTLDELRAKALVQGQRYADMPGTGPAGTTCKSCAHVRSTGSHGSFSKSHPKCGLTAYTHGDATTIKLSSPSCRRYEADS